MAYRKPISPPESSCSEFLGCALADPDPVALAVLVVAASVVLLFVTLALAHIRGARSLLEEERSRVGDEAEAFAEFARRVADVEVTSTPVTDGGPGATALRPPPSDDALEAVRDAYRETVMGVPHYEDEYGESLSTNMHLEFGEDVAEAVAEGRTLTPQLKATLVDRGRTAHRQRVELLHQLEGEAEALEDAETTLRRCRRSADRIEDEDLGEYSFDGLVAEWRLLEDRREAAEAVLGDRQETVQQRDRETGTRASSGPGLEEYLYEPLEVTYPVLSEATTLVERLEDAQHRVEQALSSRT